MKDRDEEMNRRVEEVLKNLRGVWEEWVADGDIELLKTRKYRRGTSPRASGFMRLRMVLECFSVSIFEDLRSGELERSEYGSDYLNPLERRSATYVFLDKDNLPVRVRLPKYDEDAQEYDEDAQELYISCFGEMPSFLEKILKAYGFKEVKEKGDLFFPVMVNYGLSLAEMIAAGGYDFVDSDITAKHFPISGKGTAERRLVLVHFGREATTKEVLDKMKYRGLKPAGLEDLIVFGAVYQDEQRKFPIIGLGSCWVNYLDDLYYPCLFEHDDRRKLSSHYGWGGKGRDDLNGRWNGDCRFLAICK